MRVYFTHLGCKLNQAELERLMRDFLAAGHSVVGSLDEADLHVVNSCTVTHLAARDSRKVARRGARFPGLRTVLTGCYANGSPEEARSLSGVDLVVDNRDKDRLLELVHERWPEAATEGSPVPPGQPIPVSYVPLEHTHARAAVKIEDGCNMRCAFCIIPKTRGVQRSLSPERVLAEVSSLVAAGIEEVVVTGVQISSYRHGAHRLVDLVDRLLAETDVPRLRLTSIAPWQFDERLFQRLRSPRLCRHVHLSLQSGCDATLKRMRRPYDGRRFAALVERLRGEVPGIAVTTDVIVGFPGETEEEFEASLAFVERMAFARVHAFTYSEREGTEAAGLPDPVPPPVKKERMARMLSVAARGECAFVERQLGLELEVLWEDEREGYWRGTTDNYVRVSSPVPPPATRSRARLERWGVGGAEARPVAPPEGVPPLTSP